MRIFFIEIQQLPAQANTAPFIDFAADLYRGDKGWVPPLRREVQKQLCRRNNPFFEHAEMALFTAWHNGRMVGRCSAQIDHAHLATHQDGTGFFGFFDTIDDPRAAQALIAAAGQWCRARGMQRLRGPFSLCINEEIGVMVEGFDLPSMLLTPYHRPHQGQMAEAAGLSPVKDVLTWDYDCNAPLPARARQAYDAVIALPEVRFRPIDRRHLAREMAIVRAIFNEAWADNWCFVPWSDAELAKAVKEFELVLIDRLAMIAEIDGEPVAIAICLPNLNDAIRDLDGRLGPLSQLKLLWRVKAKNPTSAKLPLMGMRKWVRRNRRYAGLATALCVSIHDGFMELGVRRAELGWTLEDNHLVNAMIRRIGSQPVKRHRVYEMAL